MRAITGAAILLLASTAHAQVVYRCAANGKPVSFQSEPCAPGARMTNVIDAPPDRRPPRAIQGPVYSQEQQSGPQWSAPTEQDRQREKCNKAKADREDTLNSVGLRRTFDLVSSLDAKVTAACKGV